jgi:hypothetical protein
VIKQTIATKKLYEDVGFSIDEVLIKLETFKQIVNEIFNAPPPK